MGVAKPIVTSLTIMGLTLFWFTTYAIVSAVNGHVPSVTKGDVPSRIFAFGGVFGMQRPVVEVVWRVFCAALFGIGALGICDLFYARHTKARYFALHVICNGWIALLCLPDLYAIMTDPLGALSRRETVNHWPTSLVFSIHCYHMLFFSNLQFIDWYAPPLFFLSATHAQTTHRAVSPTLTRTIARATHPPSLLVPSRALGRLHHILMVVIGAPLVIAGEIGPLMNFNHFFMCGVPGGFDYAMLFAVKHGWMSPLTEKRWNSAVNVWVREPALIVVATLGWLQLHVQDEKDLHTWGVGAVRVFLMLLAAWNGLFFMERVVGNYHVCEYKAKLEAKAKKDACLSASHPPSPLKSPSANGQDTGSVYESKEHFTGGLPFVGMKISISKNDLQDISKDGAAANANGARHEAFPVGNMKDKGL